METSELTSGCDGVAVSMRDRSARGSGVLLAVGVNAVGVGVAVGRMGVGVAVGEVVGVVIRPILLPSSSVNQIAPSGPDVMCSGCPGGGEGIGNSVTTPPSVT